MKDRLIWTAIWLNREYARCVCFIFLSSSNRAREEESRGRMSLLLNKIEAQGKLMARFLWSPMARFYTSPAVRFDKLQGLLSPTSASYPSLNVALLLLVLSIPSAASSSGISFLVLSPTRCSIWQNLALSKTMCLFARLFHNTRCLMTRFCFLSDHPQRLDKGSN